MASALTVVKVGGSLFDLPDLGRRLSNWLERTTGADVLLIPGGGVTANAIRSLDAWQQLGEDRAHWLALRSLSLSAHFLAAVLPSARVIDSVQEAKSAERAGPVPILDAYRFIQTDEGRHGCLPRRWDVTSDSIAARAAIVAGAGGLVLLKSATIPAGMDWSEAGRQGFVDSYFARVLEKSQFDVAAVNLREWTP